MQVNIPYMEHLGWDSIGIVCFWQLWPIFLPGNVCQWPKNTQRSVSTCDGGTQGVPDTNAWNVWSRRPTRGQTSKKSVGLHGWWCDPRLTDVVLVGGVVVSHLPYSRWYYTLICRANSKIIMRGKLPNIQHRDVLYSIMCVYIQYVH